MNNNRHILGIQTRVTQFQRKHPAESLALIRDSEQSSLVQQELSAFFNLSAQLQDDNAEAMAHYLMGKSNAVRPPCLDVVYSSGKRFGLFIQTGAPDISRATHHQLNGLLRTHRYFLTEDSEKTLAKLHYLLTQLSATTAISEDKSELFMSLELHSSEQFKRASTQSSNNTPQLMQSKRISDNRSNYSLAQYLTRDPAPLRIATPPLLGGQSIISQRDYNLIGKDDKGYQSTPNGQRSFIGIFKYNHQLKVKEPYHGYVRLHMNFGKLGEIGYKASGWHAYPYTASSVAVNDTALLKSLDQAEQDYLRLAAQR